jgi:hypothetical protein
MINKTCNRIEVKEIYFPDILSVLQQHGKPLIITKDGQGVAAVIPYSDPKFLRENRQDDRAF